MSDFSPGIGLLAAGIGLVLIGLYRLTGSHRVMTKDGISFERGYHFPKPRWGFVAIGILLLIVGYAMTFAQ